MSYPQRSILAAVTLFFLAPLVAEYLLGDFPATFLSPLLPLAPLYGGGALLIRELTRRSGRGWPTILLLGVAYAIIEEAFTTQSLFNPDLFGMHCISSPTPGFPRSASAPGGPSSCSTSTPSGASVSPSHSSKASILRAARTPWLGKVGLSVAAALFAFGIYANTSYSLHHDPFRASAVQLIVSALLVVVFAAAAFLIPPPAPSRNPSPAPSPWITGVAAFLLGAAVFLSPILWNWGAVALILAIDLVFLVGLGLFSQCSAWTPLHTLSVGAGGALLYGVHAFMQPPVVPCPKSIALASHVLFLVLAIAVVALAVLRTRSALLFAPQEQSPAQP